MPLRWAKRLWAYAGLPVPRVLLGTPVLTHVDLVRSRQSEPHVLGWMVEHLRPGGVCLDVGAHHGWMSMVAARKVGVTGRVVAFEPAPLLAGYLRYIQRVNRLPQLEVVAKAVADRVEQHRPFRILDQGDSFMNALAELQIPRDPARASSVLAVETTTLDAFCEASGLVPDLIKVDTEGAELLVCHGAARTLARHHPVIVLATHPLWLPPGQSVGQLFHFLERLGYRVLRSQVSEYGGAQFGDYLLVADADTGGAPLSAKWPAPGTRRWAWSRGWGARRVR